MSKKKNEKFKERMHSRRMRQARAERLYRFGMVSVMLGIGLACIGAIRL
jgi:hypothetical protein